MSAWLISRLFNCAWKIVNNSILSLTVYEGIPVLDLLQYRWTQRWNLNIVSDMKLMAHLINPVWNTEDLRRQCNQTSEITKRVLRLSRFSPWRKICTRSQRRCSAVLYREINTIHHDVYETTYTIKKSHVLKWSSWKLQLYTTSYIKNFDIVIIAFNCIDLLCTFLL